MNRWIFVTISCFYALLFLGCTEKTGPLPPTGQQCLERGGVETAMQEAEDMLFRMNFVIEKFDPDSGVILTRWLYGAQFFQFWRGDTVGKFNTAESNMHSISRQVEMEFSSEGGQVCIDCRVNMRRFSVVDDNIRGMAWVDSLVTGGDIDEQEIRLSEDKEYNWIDLGRDGNLERKLLDIMKKRLNEKGDNA